MRSQPPDLRRPAGKRPGRRNRLTLVCLPACLPVILLGLALGPAQAQTSVYTPHFQAAVARVAGGTADAPFAGGERRATGQALQAREIAATLTALATAAISQAPHQLKDVLAAVAATAPDAVPEVAASLAHAFPAYAAAIARAAGVPAQRSGQVVPVAATSAPPAGTLAVRLQGAIAMRELPQQALDGHARRVATWAISSIASAPEHLDSIVARSVQSVPGQETALAAAIADAYPGFAGRIAAAASAPGAAAIPLAAGRPAVSRAAARPANPVDAPVAPVTQEASGETSGIADDDPIEPVNRLIFAINDTIDVILLRPLAIAYSVITPDPVIDAVHRFFLNLDAPVIFANDLLQAEFGAAAVTLGRFGVNSSIGLLGFFDPAQGLGLMRHHADFGQTLHSYGTGGGIYLVLPILGPSNARDAVGTGVDVLLNPLTWLLTPGQRLGVAAADGVHERELLLEALDQLRESSVDHYTALKSAYQQRRRSELGRGVAAGADKDLDKLFDEAE